MDESKALLCLSALAHETRLAIIRRLVPHGRHGLCAGAIGRQVKAPASRLSFHLSALEQAGLIGSRRESRQVIYWIEPAMLGGLINYLLTDCACARPDLHGPCRGQTRRNAA